MFFGEKKLVALDIGTSGVKLAEIEFSRKGPTLTKFAVYPLKPGLVNGGEIIDPPVVTQCIEGLLKGSKSKRKHVSTGMWGSSVIVKKISMPKMDPSLVSEQLKWEAEQYIPFDLNEISLDHYILQNRGAASESMEVLLVAAKQEFLFRYLEVIDSIPGMKCSLVDVSGFALANCFEVNYGNVGGTVALLHIGAGVTHFVVIDNGEVIFCRDIMVGGSVYSSELNKQMGVSFDEAEALKISASFGQEVPEEVNAIITATNENVADEIQNSVEFFNATSNGSSIQRLFVSGGSIFVPGLVERVANSMGVRYEVFDPFLKISYATSSFTNDQINQIKSISPVAIGLALRKMSEK